MKASLFAVVVVLTCLVSSAAFANEPAATTRTTRSPEVAPATAQHLIKSCERLVLKGLQMVVYRDRESGELATVKFEPNWSLGGKVGLTYRF